MEPLDSFISGFVEEPGFLNYASFGPISEGVAAESDAWTGSVSRARFGSIDALLQQETRAREAVGELLGFDAGNVVLQPNTSMGLMHALFGLTGPVLVSPADFPSLPFAAVRAEQALGATGPIWLETEHGTVTPGQIRDQITSTTAAVAVSLVDPRTGYLADIEGIRQVIGDRLLIVDAIQGAGVVDAPFEVADVVAGGGQKWLRAGWGTGYLALSDRAVEQLTPVVSGFPGATGYDDEMVWDEVPLPIRGAGAFRVSNPDWIAAARLATAAEDVAEAGVAGISAQVAVQVSRIIDIADEFAVPVISPRNETERAGIVVVEPPTEQLSALTASLYNHGVSTTTRQGRVRIAAHAGTTVETLEMLRAAFTSYASTVRIF
ncbi:aminotransferase class V-fold PLP-dependent enzyme [Amnibacterium flavum]|uniref:Aminotransferase n=1 Tax=Amnibacterium flavum TaxID=2173173 RepID=A0A2V1HTT2_9MICO|nr:aminotransferase class V-fold PLP-dependent enzyme [Amnibacterium flavum]PVZ93717.1 aminotransferase [Amnibacterium flavum]